MRIATLCLLALLCAAPVSAQNNLSGHFPLNPGLTGQPVTFEVSGTTLYTLTSGCGFNAIRAGSPTGPAVFTPLICPRILIRTGPGASATVTWSGQDNAGNFVPGGLYYFEISARDPSGQLTTAFFPIRLDDPAMTPQQNGPTLTGQVPGQGSPNINGATGGTLDLTITAPWEAGAFYLLAISSTTNTGIPAAGGTLISLDNDALFAATFLGAAPPVFVNFTGAIGAGGRTNPISINVPAGVLPSGFPFCVQGVVIGNGTSLTNPLSVSAR